MSTEIAPRKAVHVDAVVSRYITRRIARLRVQDTANGIVYNGKEGEFNFHGGFVSGYVKGRLSAFEDLADELGIAIDG